MTDPIHELLVTDIAAEKLGRRDISDQEAEQLLGNANVTVRNPGAGGDGERLLLIGRADGGRTLTLVVEPTIEPTPGW